MTTEKPNIVRPKTDKISEALEQGLRIPWMGIRPDIVLRKGALQSGDKPTYILEDPIRGVHFELGEAEAQLFLCLASEKNLKAAVEKLLRTTSLRPSIEDILSFVQMLQAEKLAILPPEIALHTADIRDKKKPSLFRRIFFGYLFFKIPVFRPEGFLNAIYSWVSPLWSKPFLFLYTVLGVVGLIFMSQQTELYFHTISHLFTPRGALIFFCCLTMLKILHELGHALTAKHHGVFVRRIGLAFMVFMPMLYTDTTDAWKLPSQKGRLMIGAAGILTELCVAAISLFFWAVLPDGILRSLMFYLSGASAVSTVLVNLNPLMRFDGYYLLMDYLQISNLRTRSMAMFRYFRHRLFVDWQGPKPEEHPRSRSMAIFGFFTMLYRVSLFFSITLTIYHKVFKALGVFLLAMQVFVMVGIPLTNEVLFLMKNRKYWGSRKRVFAAATGFACLMGILFVPLPDFGKLPALFLFRNVARIEAPGPGKIVSPLPPIGKQVEKGDILLRIRDDKLEETLKKVQYDLAQTRVSVELLGSGGTEGGYRKWLMAEQQRLEAEEEKIRQSLEQLEIYAPLSGRVLDVNETLRQGSYIFKKNYLMSIGDNQAAEIYAYVREDRYQELKEKHIVSGEVIFQDLETHTLDAAFKEILDFPVSSFPNETLFDYAGGPILSSLTPSGDVKPRQAYYPMIFDIPGSSVPLTAHLQHGVKCMVQMEYDETFSIMERMIRKAWKVMAAEGFI